MSKHTTRRIRFAAETIERAAAVHPMSASPRAGDEGHPGCGRLVGLFRGWPRLPCGRPSRAPTSPCLTVTAPQRLHQYLGLPPGAPLAATASRFPHQLQTAKSGFSAEANSLVVSMFSGPRRRLSLAACIAVFEASQWATRSSPSELGQRLFSGLVT